MACKPSVVAMKMTSSDPFPRMVEKIPAGEIGSAKVKHFQISESQSEFCKLRALLNHRATEYISPGEYARLLIHGGVMMTDTDMEKATNLELIKQARGHVLVGGLGLGMVVFTLLAKKPEIHSLTVLEINRDVMDLITPHLPKDPRLTVIGADAFKWERKNKRDPKFNTIFMDIWPNISGDYGHEVARLYGHYRPMLSPKGWIGDWQTEFKRYNKERT